MSLIKPSVLWAHLSPAWVATRTTFPAYRWTFLKIGVLSGIAVGLETTGLGLIYVLILNFTGGDPTAKFDVAFLVEASKSPLAVTLAIVALLTLAIQLKYRIVKETAQVAAEAGSYAGKLSLEEARKLISNGGPELQEPRKVQKILRVLLREVPFACGFVAGGMSRLVVHILQALVITLILLYLSPILTLVLIVLTFIVVTLLASPLDEVVAVGLERSNNVSAFGSEAEEITGQLLSNEVDAPAFTERVRRALDSGRAHDILRLRLAQRKVRQAGPLVMGYVYPIAITFIALVYIYQGDLAPDISEVALYFLLFRQFAISMNMIAKSFMSFSRHYQPLLAYQQLLQNGDLPSGDITIGDDEE